MLHSSPKRGVSNDDIRWENELAASLGRAPGGGPNHNLVGLGAMRAWISVNAGDAAEEPASAIAGCWQRYQVWSVFPYCP